jgi:hypothetical protein
VVDYSPAVYWAKEREAIRIRKEDPDLPFWEPLTRDPILAKYRFCNVRREDDRVTRWIKENIRDRFNDGPYLWTMLCIARMINWPPTLQELIDETCWPSNKLFNRDSFREFLQARQNRGEKVFTGAYIIPPGPSGRGNKVDYISHVIGSIWEDRNELRSKSTMRETHTDLLGYPGWGPFLAYQAVVDMRFTPLLQDARDVHTWAAAGPGTIRGLNRLYGREVTAALSQEQALQEMLEMYAVFEPMTGIPVDLSDIPNVLCETDKYLRVKNGEGAPRALYVPGRGA